MKPGFDIKITINLEDAWKRDKKATKAGMIAIGFQLLHNTLRGSPNESTVPPIDLGFLRGSGSVFFEKELLATSAKFGDAKRGDDVSPNESYNGKKNQVTVGFNAPYAKKLHEGEMGKDWNPGPQSRISGDVGDHFLLKHLKADGKELFQLYTDIYKKEFK